jgi:protein involved in polysaccharide export with SLBB domain
LIKYFSIFAALSIVACATPSPYQPITYDTYVLQRNDVVKIYVYDEDEFSGNFKISDDKTISLPLAGPVEVAGRTDKQAAALIKDTLKRKGLLRNPEVSVELYKSKPVYVFGEVNRAGRFTYLPETSVYQAIAQAGGYSYRADKNDITLHRRGASFIANQNTILFPGDTVDVGERFF